jgi:CRISP-associated protein Cas1
LINPPINVDGGYLDQPLLPVRRLHNYVYCKRLFYYQWVENIFQENADTVAGKLLHRNVDKPTKLKGSSDLELPEGASLRSLKIQSEKLGLIGVVDLVVEGTDGLMVVEYKKGSAGRSEEGGRVVKEADAVQVLAHAMLLAEIGQPASKAYVYYAADRRKVEVPLNEKAFSRVKELIAQAKSLAKSNSCPPPLQGDVRCLYCSAYPICLPGESSWWAAQPKENVKTKQLSFSFLIEDPPLERQFDEADLPVNSDTERGPRPENDDGEILIIQTPGTQVGSRGNQIVVSRKGETLSKQAINQINSIYLYGAVQITAQASQACLEKGIVVSFFSPAGRFIGSLQGLPASGIDARRGQYRLFQQMPLRLLLASKCIKAKIHNQRVMVMRNGNASKTALHTLAKLRDQTEQAADIPELLGIEGAAATIYFENFQSMLKGVSSESFDFQKRNRRPPKDPINALLSMGYSMLTKEITGICHSVGLDPFLGFLHQPRYGRPALALDLMEEFRPLIADSVAISLLNRNELNKGDFIQSSSGTFLNSEGRKAFWESWFRRLDTKVKHPVFGYKMSYRRMLVVQVRQLWRFLRGESKTYQGFTTR